MEAVLSTTLNTAVAHISINHNTDRKTKISLMSKTTTLNNALIMFSSARIRWLVKWK